MFEPSHYGAERLLVHLFHFLSQEAKRKLGLYKESNVLDAALYRMIKESANNKELFPEWFCEEFSGYDSLYSTLTGLDRVFLHAVRGGSMRLSLGGGADRYEFPMSEEECAERLTERDITVEQVRRWAQTLEQYLSEGERKR